MNNDQTSQINLSRRQVWKYAGRWHYTTTELQFNPSDIPKRWEILPQAITTSKIL